MSAGIWSFSAVIGEGNVKVECTFDMSSDGDVENLHVTHGAINVTPYLAAYQIEELECECYDHYCTSAKEHNDDLKINNYLTGVGQ